MTDMRDSLEELNNAIGDLGDMVEGITCFTNRVPHGEGKDELTLVHRALTYLQKDMERRGNEAWDAWHTMEKERPLKVVTAGKVS